MRLCVATSFDDNYAEMGHLCVKTLEKYANKFNFDLYVNKEQLSDRPPAWDKILLIQKLFQQGYDFVLWVDADALFVRYTKNILNEIQPSKHLYMVASNITEKAMFGVQITRQVPNTGVMLVRNCQWSSDFLQSIWNKTEYLDHKWWENAAVMDLLGYHHLLDEKKTNNIDLLALRYIHWLSLDWNSMPGISEGDNPIIQHYPAISLDLRISKMKYAINQVYHFSDDELRTYYQEQEELMAWFGNSVRNGPFVGMSYLSSPYHIISKIQHILGSYEAELHDIIEEICNENLDTVVNIGCAEGYYAVGLARRLVASQVYAFDLDPDLRHTCDKVAKLNNVASRVTVGGECTIQYLSQLTQSGNVFIFVDCEGCELNLLDPSQIPDLSYCTILVELHDFVISNIASVLRERFQQTHEINTVYSASRNLDDYPVLNALSPKSRHIALYEFRPAPMQWFYMKPYMQRPQTFHQTLRWTEKGFGFVSRQRNLDRIFYQFDTLMPSDLELNGWSHLEINVSGVPYRWTDNPISEVIVSLKSARHYRLQFQIVGMLQPHLLQTLEVYVNNQKQDIYHMADSIHAVDISDALLEDESDVYVHFKMLDVKSPKELGINEDTRLLGLAFSWLKIEPLES